jgi:SAM-dependent methyltransferase
MSDLYRKQSCRYCATPLPPAFLDLGPVALANSYVKPEELSKPEFKCSLALTRCAKCGLVQLTHVVPPDMMFKNYLYVSSTTKTFRDHFAQYASRVKSRVTAKEKPLAVDIGSNDGLLLSCYQKEGMQAVGIDPAENLSQAANANGLVTLNRYFDAESVKQIRERFGPADAVSANNVFAHIDDIESVCRNVSALLDEKGIFSIEFPYLVTMMDELLFDMIYHEHLSYIAVTPLQFVLNRFGFQIFDIERVASHGGSLRVFAQKTSGGRPVAPIVGELIRKEQERGLSDAPAYDVFAQQVRETKSRFLEQLAAIKKAGKSVSGYGAPAKASTLINYFGLNKQDIAYVVDDNPLKQGYLVPGAQIPIVPSARLLDKPTDYVVLFAWNFAKEILQKIGHLKEKGVEFIVPVGQPVSRS